MKTKMIIQWAVFLLAALGVLGLSLWAIVWSILVVMGFTGLSLLLILIVTLGYGVVWAMCTLMCAGVLVQIGWLR